MRYLTTILTLISFVCSAQLVTNNSKTPTELVEDVLVGSGVEVSNVTFFGHAEAIGEFDAQNSNIGLPHGILMSTGSVLDNTGAQKNGPVGPNNNPGASTEHNRIGDADLDALIGASTKDAAILEFDFVPQGDTIEFSYVFASEEYLEYTNDKFIDVFAFFISGPGIVGTKNLALVPVTNEEISIQTINNIKNSHLYINNGTGDPFDPTFADPTVTNFDGFTVPLTAVSKVQPCKTYHLKLAIADGYDYAFDSGVFLKGGSLNSAPKYEPNLIDSLNLSADDLLIPEGCSSGVLELKRTEDLWSTLNLGYSIYGTAQNGTDYNLLSGNVLFAKKDSVEYVKVTPILDGLSEGEESITLRFPSSDVCKIDSVDFEFKITDLKPMTSKTDSVSVACPGDDVDIDANFSGGFNPYEYNWSSGGESITENVSPNVTTTYQFTVTDVCGVSTQNDFKVKVPTFSPMLLSMPNDTMVYCSGVKVNLTPAVTGGAGGYKYSWSSGDKTSSIEPQIIKTTTFDLSVLDACDNQVVGSVGVDLSYPEFTVDIKSDTTVCPGDSVLFTAIPSGGIEPYIYLWDNGVDESTAKYASESSKIIKLTMRDSCGIIPIKDSVSLTIQKPDADFIINSPRLETDETIYFVDASVGNIVAYDWDLGNGETSDLSNPTTVYTSDSVYKVTLTVTDDLGCTDWMTKLVEIVPPLYLWVPNAFTPSNDPSGINEVFMPKGVGIAIYELIIFNRWGQEMFISDDINIGWDGTYFNGKEAPEDVYVYKLYAMGDSGKEIEKMGTVTLIR